MGGEWDIGGGGSGEDVPKCPEMSHFFTFLFLYQDEGGNRGRWRLNGSLGVIVAEWRVVGQAQVAVGCRRRRMWHCRNVWPFS